MPKTLRLTRRFPAAISEDAQRALRKFCRTHGMSADMALTFLLSEHERIVAEDRLFHRLRAFVTEHGTGKNTTGDDT